MFIDFRFNGIQLEHRRTVLYGCCQLFVQLLQRSEVKLVSIVDGTTQVSSPITQFGFGVNNELMKLFEILLPVH